MSDVPDAIVEKAFRAYIEAHRHPPVDGMDAMRAGLAAVLPDLAEEKRRAIDAALILAAAHDDAPAARPVVDERLHTEGVEYETELRAEGWVRREEYLGLLQLGNERTAERDALAEENGRLRQDAADVRRAVAEDVLLRAAEDARGMHDPVAADCEEWASWLEARIAREVGDRDA